jgi:Protein of unknown function DUF262
MRFIPSDPDISTIFNRIQSNDIDLQPDFQRGEVWTISKQQRLIDSILRGWIIPPILVIATKNSEQQVLDGQQRLASIRNFLLGEFAVDGLIEPFDTQIAALHQKRYEDLPPEIQKRFDRTPIRLFEVIDFSPNEPAEIFFRLNQPTPLTAAERRNAFFGPVRDQIRQLSNELENRIGHHSLSFTNSRMAYDEIIGRIVCTIEAKTLQRKVTAATVDELYRRKQPINPEITINIQQALNKFCDVINKINNLRQTQLRLSRATLHSWLLFILRNKNIEIPELCEFLQIFETYRSDYDRGISPDLVSRYANSGNIDLLISSSHVFNDRASSRVNDASSVIVRDLVLWIHWIFGYKDPSDFRKNETTQLLVNSIENMESLGRISDFELDIIIDYTDWGAVF